MPRKHTPSLTQMSNTNPGARALRRAVSRALHAWHDARYARVSVRNPEDIPTLDQRVSQALHAYNSAFRAAGAVIPNLRAELNGELS